MQFDKLKSGIVPLSGSAMDREFEHGCMHILKSNLTGNRLLIKFQTQLTLLKGEK
jgi:hypothetical protein